MTNRAALRSIPIDRARRRHTLRHGGGQHRVDVDGLEITTPADEDQLIAVSEALDELAVHHQAEGELVKLRTFAGMTIDEASEALGISPRTAKYH